MAEEAKTPIYDEEIKSIKKRLRKYIKYRNLYYKKIRINPDYPNMVMDRESANSELDRAKKSAKKTLNTMKATRHAPKKEDKREIEILFEQIQEHEKERAEKRTLKNFYAEGKKRVEEIRKKNGKGKFKKWNEIRKTKAHYGLMPHVFGKIGARMGAKRRNRP